ncbi:MAG: hypothetical protein U9P70_03810 [Patescibacteria group bacterium]|nr:hypothetical protein [Patescibacteria group bacterium]
MNKNEVMEIFDERMEDLGVDFGEMRLDASREVSEISFDVSRLDTYLTIQAKLKGSLAFDSCRLKRAGEPATFHVFMSKK